MASKIYRIKKEHVLSLSNTEQSTLEKAFINGYSFVECDGRFYVLTTNKKHTILSMDNIEIEIVE
jgi:uncharacterized protein YhbP (UPF0306 family)